MNGRVYDPLLGRFLSTDPHIQSPLNLQSHNRYSYVLNNPLSYTDPSGFFFKSLFKKIKRAISRLVSKIKNAIADFIRKYGWTIAAIAITYYGSPLVGNFAAGFGAGLVASGGDVKAGLIGGLTAHLGATTPVGEGGGGFTLNAAAQESGRSSINWSKYLSYAQEGYGIARKLFGSSNSDDESREITMGGTASPINRKFGNGGVTESYESSSNSKFDVYNPNNISGTHVTHSLGKPYEKTNPVSEWRSFTTDIASVDIPYNIIFKNFY